VRGAVHQPGEVKNTSVSQRPSNPEASPEILAPEILSHKTGHDETHEECKPWIQPFLKHHHRIVVEIVEVDLLPCLPHPLILLNVEPAHVSKEKSTQCVVRVGGSFRVLVVNPMVARPVED